MGTLPAAAVASVLTMSAFVLATVVQIKAQTVAPLDPPQTTAQPSRRQAPSANGIPHVRGLGSRTAATLLVAEASRRSPTVRALILALDKTDVIVLVELENRYGMTPGALYFSGLAHGTRWLRIVLHVSMKPVEQIGQLAHELQHAREVAMVPDVTDAASLGRLYERIGYSVGKGEYETDGACETQRRALADLGVRR